MTPETTCEIRPDAAGWATGSLDPRDVATFEEHLRYCAQCRSDVSEFESMSRAFHSMAPSLEPPADLESKVLASAGLAATTARPAGKDPTILSLVNDTHASSSGEADSESAPARIPKWWHRHWNLPVMSLVAAAVTAVVAASAITMALQTNGIFSSGGAKAVIPLHAEQLGMGSSPVPSGKAVAQHSAGGWHIHLAVAHLRPSGPGEFYECWYAGPGDQPDHPNLITAGTFIVGPSGTASVSMWSAADPHQFPVMEITAEHSGDGRKSDQGVLIGSASA